MARPLARSINLLSSHVWRQDHNGFSHQDPGFIDHVINKKAEVVRVYLPPDANCLLSVTDHRQRILLPFIPTLRPAAPRQIAPTSEAVKHCTSGLSAIRSGRATTMERSPMS